MQVIQGELFPRGYFNVFGSEFAARFCFWAVQSIIVLFLTKQFLVSDSVAYSTAASYEALTYAATFFGGYFADKFLGSFRVLLAGILLSLIGMLVLTIPTQTAAYGGLALLVIGMGLYMPTNAALLSDLYDDRDAHREGGYFYFYVATNLGGIFGPIFFGIASEYFSLRVGFFAGALFLALCFLVYCFHRKNIRYFKENIKQVNFLKWSYFIGAIVVLVLASYALITKSDWTRDLLFMIGFVALVAILYQSRHSASSAKKTLWLVLFFCVLSLFFYACMFQILSSIVTFTRDYVGRDFFGVRIPIASFVSLEPFFVVCTAPLVNYVLSRWGSVSEPVGHRSVFYKFAMSFLMLAASFFVLSIAANFYMKNTQLLSASWLVLSAFFMGLGEVFLMPVLLALVTKDAPAHLKNTLVGFLYVCIAFSSYFAGVIANLTKTLPASSPIGGYYHTYVLICVVLGTMAAGLYGAGRTLAK